MSFRLVYGSFSSAHWPYSSSRARARGAALSSLRTVSHSHPDQWHIVPEPPRLRSTHEILPLFLLPIFIASNTNVPLAGKPKIVGFSNARMIALGRGVFRGHGDLIIYQNVITKKSPHCCGPNLTPMRLSQPSLFRTSR